MATTLRLPPALQAEAAAYASSLGISAAALIAVALREYLDARKGTGEPEKWDSDADAMAQLREDSEFIRENLGVDLDEGQPVPATFQRMPRGKRWTPGPPGPPERP
jgi:hypothetical protein